MKQSGMHHRRGFGAFRFASCTLRETEWALEIGFLKETRFLGVGDSSTNLPTPSMLQVHSPHKLVHSSDKLVHSSDKLADSLNKLVHSLGKLVHSLDKLVYSLDKLADSLGKLVHSLDELVHSLGKLVHFYRN
jgi:hypothetical protein